MVDRAPSLRIEGITRRHLLAFDQLSGIPEMHDRFIAAVALQLGAPVITRDRLLSDHPLIQTIWGGEMASPSPRLPQFDSDPTWAL